MLRELLLEKFQLRHSVRVAAAEARFFFFRELVRGHVRHMIASACVVLR